MGLSTPNVPQGLRGNRMPQLMNRLGYTAPNPETAPPAGPAEADGRFGELRAKRADSLPHQENSEWFLSSELIHLKDPFEASLLMNSQGFHIK